MPQSTWAGPILRIIVEKKEQGAARGLGHEGWGMAPRGGFPAGCLGTCDTKKKKRGTDICLI